MSVAALPQSEPSRAIAGQLVLVSLACIAVGFAIRFAAFRLSMPDSGPEDFLGAMCRWDCTWYVKLAESGYDRFPTRNLVSAGNWAFFPLYPALIGAIHALTQIPTLVVAAAAGTILSAATPFVAWRLLGRDIRAFALLSAYLLCGPFSIYFTTFLTEPLFIFLTVSVFAALGERRFLLAGLLAAALSATRIVGVFIVFAIAWEVWRLHRENGGTWRDFLPAVLKDPTLVLTFAVAPLGLFAYMAFLHGWVGDALAFQHVQRAWARPSGLPPEFIWNGLTTFPRDGLWPSPSQWLAGAALVGYALTLALFLSRRTGMAIFALIALTLPLFAGLASMTRFVAAMAPLPLLIAIWLGRDRAGFALGVLLLLGGSWFVTLAWLDGALALV